MKYTNKFNTLNAPLYIIKYENEKTFDENFGTPVYITKVWYESAYERFLYSFSTSENENEVNEGKTHFYSAGKKENESLTKIGNLDWDF